MKQTKPIGKFLGILALFLFNCCIDAAPVTSTITLDGISLTINYDNVVCLGSFNTITFTLENTNNIPYADNIRLRGFTPDGSQPQSPGLAFVSAVPPQPSGVITFDPLTPFNECSPCDNCAGGAAARGTGEWNASENVDPLANGIPYTFSITYQATACGIQLYLGQLVAGPPVLVPPGCFDLCSCFDTIAILIIPYATLSDVVVTGAVCNNNAAGITGILPDPLCPSGCTGPLVDCSLVQCPGCTGASGPFPFHYTVADVTGGTVTLLDPTGGLFSFVPDSSFQGTGIFEYNVISDTTPPNFCSATAPGEVFLTVVQSPLTTLAFFSGCGNTAITGNLNNFVTGGSGNYTFSGLGPASCGQVTIPPNGIFTFTAPTGPSNCTFNYFVTDATFNCTGSGSVSVDVFATPTALDATIETCIDQSVAGILTAAGGTPGYTFTITTSPVNGNITFFDPNTGDFIYTPNASFTGSDTFEFTATDVLGCTSLPATITISVNPQPTTSATSIIGCANTQLTGSLTGLVTGGTGTQIFSISGPSAQPCGFLQIFADGTFQFNPTTFFTGTCDFNYQVTQGGCPGSGPTTITFDIESAPIVTGSIFNVCQFGNITGNLVDNLLSSMGTTTFTAVGGPTNGMLSLDPAGPYSFTATIASGTAGFVFRAISDLLPCPSATAAIRINVHQNPRTTTGANAVCSGTSTMGNLNPLVTGNPPFTFTGPFTEVNGTATVSPNGLFTFTPNVGVTGGSFTFGVTDIFGCSATGTELIEVNPSPEATGVTGVACSNGTATGSVAGAVSGGTPGYVFFLVPPVINGMATVNSAGDFTFTPNPGAATGGFGFEAIDTRGCRAVANVDITINPSPTASTGSFTGCDNGFTGSLVSLVVGVNPPFTFSGPIGAVIGGSVTVDPSGEFEFTPNGGNTGFGSFNFQATDSGNPPCTSNVAPVNLTIEEGPQALQANYDACEDVPLIVSAASGLANFVTGGLPPYTFFQTGATPPCAAALTVNSDGSFNFIPALNFVGDCSFFWQVTDSVPCTSNVSTGTIAVHPTPVAADAGPFPACQLNAFTGNLNDFMSVGTPPYSFTGGNPVNGTIDFLLPTGPFSFTPIAIGLASFQYSAIDSFGCQSNTGTILFDVAESPIITSPSPLEVCSNSSVTSIAVATGSPAIQPFNFSITGSVNGTAVIDSTTPTTVTFTFTPNVTDFPTPTVMGSVTIRATAAAPSTCFDEVTVDIIIHQAPVITVTGLGSCTGNFTGNLNQFVTGGVPPYLFGPAGIVPTNPSGCALVTLDVFGNFSFSGSTEFPCPCAFDFTVTESSNLECTTTGTIEVCAHQPPFANNVNTCQCANVPLALVLSNFVTGGQPPFTFTIVGVPVGGTVIMLDATTGTVVFIPFPGFNGFASFQYQVTDSNVPPCTSNIGTVTIQIPCCPATGTSTVT